MLLLQMSRPADVLEGGDGGKLRRVMWLLEMCLGGAGLQDKGPACPVALLLLVPHWTCGHARDLAHGGKGFRLCEEEDIIRSGS